MKKISKILILSSLVLTFSFDSFCQTSSSDSGIVKFLAGNLSDKTSAVKEGQGEEGQKLALMGIDFSIENFDLLKNKRELSALAVASLYALPKKEIKSDELSKKIILIFSKFSDDTVKIASLEKLALGEGKDSQKEIVSLLNEYLSSSENTDSPVTASVLNAAGKTGDEDTFGYVYSGWKNNKWPSFKVETENALASLAKSQFKKAAASIFTASYIENLNFLTLIQKKYENNQEFVSEVAENSLSAAINSTEDVTDSTSPSISLQLKALSIITASKWTRALPLVKKYFSLAKEEFSKGIMTAEQFASVISDSATFSSKEIAGTLSEYLAEINSAVEKTAFIPDGQVLSAIINGLGELGDKSAFDNLLYVTYLNYPEEIKSSARAALSKLKW